MERVENIVNIAKEVQKTRCSFAECFEGFEKIDAVRRVFGDATARILEGLWVEFTEATIYMRVDDLDGHLLINPKYFLEADTIDLYLDVIHELVHVRQFMDGKVSEESVKYTERPLEIEAYKITVEEARALGIDEKAILDYLNSDLLDGEELKQLAETVGVGYESDPLS